MKSLNIQQYTELFKPERIPNLKSYLSAPDEWPVNRSIVAMDMGGTNFRIGNVHFDEKGKAEISDLKIMPMPGRDSAITADQFFEFYEDMKADYKAESVGLCFSYPAEILENGNARIIAFTKGIQISGAENRILSGTVLNDTTAVQLGTRGANMAIVLGTGLNISYDRGDMIISSECGTWTEFPKEDFDFGDMAQMQVSGAYLRPLIAKCNKNGKATQTEIYERAAKIVAAEIYGIAKYAGIEKIRIAAEGSVFYNVDELRNMIIGNLNELGCEYEILDGRDTTLIGAAIAALK